MRLNDFDSDTGQLVTVEHPKPERSRFVTGLLLGLGLGILIGLWAGLDHRQKTRGPIVVSLSDPSTNVRAYIPDDPTSLSVVGVPGSHECVCYAVAPKEPAR